VGIVVSTKLKYLLKIVALVASTSVLSSAYAEEPKPSAVAGSEAVAKDAQRAQELLAKAVTAYRQQGDKACAAFNAPGEFVDGELYVWVLGTDGIMLASGGSSSALIGRNVANMRDAVGTPLFAEMLEKAKTSKTGVVEYRWLNRLHNKPERKVTHFQKVGERLLAVGYYIPRATPEQAMAMLDRAVAAMKANPTKAVADFNALNGGFIEDDLYVFAVDLEEGKFRAHGVSPRLVGTNSYKLTDRNGTPIVRLMVDALRNTDRGELEYAWRNPVTRQVENKHTMFRKVGDTLVGVGYYVR
jgi:cytochrome c